MKKNTKKTAAAARKRAFCVGINDYPFEGNDLNGCVNDANAWADILTKHFGFAGADVRLLLDQEATRAGILDGLKELFTGARAGDLLVFTNSSHGSYVADTTGDEPTYDEVLCPYDIDANHITDDELRELFAELPDGVNLTVVLDNCHSGTGTRAAVSDLLPGFRTPDDRRVRFLSPAVRGLPILANPFKAKPKNQSKYPESKMREVLLAGCLDNEYSYDALLGGTYNGAMTYYAIAAIRAANYQLTYAQLHDQLNNLISAYPQHPQLEGSPANKKRQIFGLPARTF